jgi:hypothetical protein
MKTLISEEQRETPGMPIFSGHFEISAEVRGGKETPVRTMGL